MGTFSTLFPVIVMGSQYNIFSVRTLTATIEWWCHMLPVKSFHFQRARFIVRLNTRLRCSLSLDQMAKSSLTESVYLCLIPWNDCHQVDLGRVDYKIEEKPVFWFSLISFSWEKVEADSHRLHQKSSHFSLSLLNNHENTFMGLKFSWQCSEVIIWGRRVS